MSFFNALLSIVCLAAPDRISTLRKDVSTVDRVSLAPGLVSVLEMPQDILEVRVGDPKSLKALISSVSPREMTLFLAHTAARPTNLIVRTDRRTFVFDVIPSPRNHQDVIKVRSGSMGALSTVVQAKELKPVLERKPQGIVFEGDSIGGRK